MSDKIRDFLKDLLSLLTTVLGWAKIVLSHNVNKWNSKVEADTDRLRKAEKSDEKGKVAEGLVNDILTIR